MIRIFFHENQLAVFEGIYFNIYVVKRFYSSNPLYNRCLFLVKKNALRYFYLYYEKTCIMFVTTLTSLGWIKLYCLLCVYICRNAPTHSNGGRFLANTDIFLSPVVWLSIIASPILLYGDKSTLIQYWPDQRIHLWHVATEPEHPTTDAD